MNSDPESVKQYLTVVNLADLEDENGDGLELTSLFKPGIFEKLNGSTSSLDTENVVQDFITYDWHIKNEHIDDWIGVMSSLLTIPNHNWKRNNLNTCFEKVSQLSLRSPIFQCGQLIRRCTNWHLELRIVEMDPEKQKYVAVFLIMEEPVNWNNDEHLHAYASVQLKNTSGKGPTAYSDLLKFGLSPSCIQRTCFPDFMPWEEFLKTKSMLRDFGQCMTIRLRLDLYGAPSLLKKSRAPSKKPMYTNAEAQDASEEVGQPLPGDIETKMKQLLASGEGSDVTIYTRGANESLKAHREMLSARAPGLIPLINDRDEIFAEFTYEAMKVLLQYIYTDKVKLPKMFSYPLNLVQEILAAGAEFQIRGLRRDVMEFLANSFGMSDSDDDEHEQEVVDLEKSTLASRNSEAAGKGSAIDQRFFMAMNDFSMRSKRERLNVTSELSTFFANQNKSVKSLNNVQARFISEDLPFISGPRIVAAGHKRSTNSKSQPTGPGDRSKVAQVKTRKSTVVLGKSQDFQKLSNATLKGMVVHPRAWR